ncbi:MAG: response regulator, partial [candidate division NC10 bacterium]|nr:response regulator [candidate division NC10 bacterium]
SRLIHKEGQPAGVEGRARDITERRRLEEQLRQSQKLEAVGLLAGGVAHDFNNLLNGIIGFAGLALRELSEGSKGYHHLSRVPSMGKQAADLVGQLLTFARKAPLERGPLNLSLLLKETAKMLQRTLPESIAIQAEPTREPLVVQADLAQAQQIILNLATNARDAMPRGGILTLRLAPVTLTRESLGSHPERRPGDFACLTVGDTGTGIPAALRARIFEPFFTTKPPGQGTGLGLASIYGIVHQHEGWLEVETAEGQGSAFHVFLPRVPVQVPAGAPPAEALPLGVETILLVEDNPMVRELGEIFLAELGYKVITAADGLEALAAFRTHPEIALVLTDAIMPRMGAQELIPALRALNSEIKVLVATGYAPQEVRASLDHLLLSGYIRKPFRQDDLAAAVRAALDGPGPRLR